MYIWSSDYSRLTGTSLQQHHYAYQLHKVTNRATPQGSSSAHAGSFVSLAVQWQFGVEPQVNQQVLNVMGPGAWNL